MSAADDWGSRPLGTAVVLGSRAVGAAITLDLLDQGVRVTTVARTATGLEPLAQVGAATLVADVTDPTRLAEALAIAAREHGPPDLIVNAIGASRPPGDGTGFGGGAMESATDAGFEGWAAAVARQAFVFLREGAGAFGDRGGTLVQITGAPARRADPGRGAAAAGGAALRALTHAAAQELRQAGIHVALVIVDGIIASPKTARMSQGMPPEALARPQDVAHAVRYLATQSRHGMTHELVITPAGTRWLP